MTPEVSVIIPNFNGVKFLLPCLTSVVAQEIQQEQLEILVIDNDSTDGSIDSVRKNFPSVKVIVNARNVGFTRAINQGIDASVSEWLLLLNNDTVMSAGALPKLLMALRESPADIAGVQPLLLWAKNSSVTDSAGIALSPRFRAYDYLHSKPTSEAPTQDAEIWGTCFGCALIKRIVFKHCGNLDPDFFAEWDDVDFSLRARWCGYRFMLIPNAQVLHHRSPTSKRDEPSKFIRLRRNQLLTYAKSLPFAMAVSLTFYRFQRDLFMSIHHLRNRQFGAVIKSWKDYFVLLPRMIARRRHLKKTAQLSPREMKQQLQWFMSEDSKSALKES
ncbi:glycosyltransferase family 2 protein [bacterium]|nr:glycosyltransferase family 2 protein [bacterium]